MNLFVSYLNKAIQKVPRTCCLAMLTVFLKCALQLSASYGVYFLSRLYLAIRITQYDNLMTSPCCVQGKDCLRGDECLDRILFDPDKIMLFLCFGALLTTTFCEALGQILWFMLPKST